MESLDKNFLKEILNCPICEGISKKIDVVKTINPKSQDTLDLMQCQNCGHWWISPLPSQDYLLKLYEDGSEFVVSKNYKGSDEISDDKLKKFFNKLIKFVEHKDLKKLNYLEIGCGSGYILNYFRKKINKCIGVEPGSWKPDGNDIVNSIDEIPNDMKFDIFVINNVLEHLTDPLSLLEKLGKIANNSAVIYLTFPNKDCLTAKFLRGKWPMVRPIGHLHYFSKKSVKIMFGKSNWKIKKIYSYWAFNSFIDLIKSFNWDVKNPLKLIYRFLFKFLILQVIMSKDQWHITGIKL